MNELVKKIENIRVKISKGEELNDEDYVTLFLSFVLEEDR